MLTHRVVSKGYPSRLDLELNSAKAGIILYLPNSTQQVLTLVQQVDY